MLIVLAPLLLSLSCKGREYEIRYKDEQVAEEPILLGSGVPHARDSDSVIAAPSPELAPAEQVRLLWSETEALLADRSRLEPMSGDERARTRDAVLTRWFELYFRHPDTFRSIGLESSEIVELLNQVYGFSPGADAAEDTSAAGASPPAAHAQAGLIRRKLEQLR